MQHVATGDRDTGLDGTQMDGSSSIILLPCCQSSTGLLTIHYAFVVTKEDIQKHFGTHGTGTITEIKLMNGFGFLEYDDPMDARDVVPGKLLWNF